ncbi:MAG: DUF1573 domain-containing protein [Deltaproteobacteria bacterium]|nr:MAG: DUF1573 domain-containing protein [Deltaproteobacteria bacterium]
MKKLTALFAAMALFAVVGMAQQEAAPAQQQQPAEGPVMTFETTEIDYGTIEKGSDPLRVFKFKNTGTEPLVIKNARGSCGCTVPKWPKEPIMPGEEGVIEVRYDTNRIGPFTKTVTLTTNEAVERHVLRIKGKVVSPAPKEEGVPASKSGF